MRVGGIVAVGGKSDYHAFAPRIHTEKPVAHGGLYLEVGVVAGDFAVEHCLGYKSHGEVVGAPDKGDSVEEGIPGGALGNSLKSGAHIAHKLGSHSLVVLHREIVMTEVDERIPLVVVSRVGSHPRIHRLEATIIHSLGEVVALAGGAKHLHCGKSHVVSPVVLFIVVWRNTRGCLARSRVGCSNGIGIAGFASEQ